MLAALLIAATTVGGFAFEITTACERTKPVSSAPAGYAATWTESIEAVEAAHASDAGFSRLMREQASQLRRDYYRQSGDERSSFDTHDHAGSLEVTQDVIAASPDVISASIGAVFYEAGMSHSGSQGTIHLIWSRRLQRRLAQGDVFAVPPDRALRRLALSSFDNPEGLQNPDDPDGLPLSWDRASIGPDGITWSFEPYELGGYASGGSATIAWPALEPYLLSDLPFVIDELREAPDVDRKPGPGTCV